jgi:type IV pilus assembly protein PilC
MPQYRYQAVDKNNKTIGGTLESESMAAASAQLRESGLAITALQESAAPPADDDALERPSPGFTFSLNDLLIKISNVKQGDVILTLRQMAALIEAGVSVVSSLAILERQTKNRKLKFTLQKVREEVEGGNALSDAMEKFPKVFPPAITTTVRTGETSGLLDTSIEQIAGYLEERAALKGQLITSLIYPAVVFSATIFVIGFMVGFVIPRIIPFLEMMGGELPWNTRILVTAANLVSGHLKDIGLAVLAAASSGILLYRVRRARYYMDLYMMRLPFFGFIIRYSMIVQFAKTLSLLIGSGVGIVESLRTTQNTIANLAVRDAIDNFIGNILLGEGLADPIAQAGHIFTPMVGSMVKVGEETGNLDASLVRVGNIHKDILESYIKKLNSSLEPFLILTLAGMVGFVAWGMVAGMLSGYNVK